MFSETPLRWLSRTKRARLATVILILAVAALGLGGCAKVNFQPGPSASGNAIDPQVVNDVKLATFVVPGEMHAAAVARAKIDWAAYVACGGKERLDVDAIDPRYDQARYADLDLIRERGFVDEEAPDAQPPERDEACWQRTLPTYAAWFFLQDEWAETTRAANSADGVVVVKARVAACLEERTSLSVSANDPTASFLVAFDSWKAKTGQVADEEGARIQAFADCTAPYFDAMAVELRSARSLALERHREVIEELSSELIAAGYVP